MLSADETQALLHKVHTAYNTNVVDLLVTAWAQAFGSFSGTDTVSLTMEGHGRETEVIGDVDLSQTVGWFTTHYPVNMQLEDAWNPGVMLVQVKEQLRRIPNHGLGYGMLRYLRGDEVLSAQPTPPVLFNYLGQFERALPASDLFSLASPLQASYSPKNHHTHDLELNAYVRHSRFQFNLIFNAAKYEIEKMQSFVEEFIERLRELNEHCLSSGVGGHTPSDFALAGLTDDQFGRLSNLLDNLDESES
jgi:non-ribosomal peptide synthase protein (TIGR01720 family)